jgi:serpin B
MDNAQTVRSDFVARLFGKLAGTQAEKNLFFSPFSIQVALAIVAAGARGETRQELVDLIGARENLDEQNQHYARLLSSVSGDSKRPFELVAANGLWGQEGYLFKPAFQETIAEFYDAALHVVDFCNKPAKAVNAINAWVSNKTQTKITGLVNRDLIDKDTRLIVTNAVYFKGGWENVFEKAATTGEVWLGPTKSTVRMMNQKGGFLYFEGNDFQAVNLPYQGRQLSMLIVLPRRNDGLAALEKRWANEQLFRRVTNGFDAKKVILSLPRFKIEAQFKLKEILCALHADLAFSDHADFSGISNEPLKISEVVHKAYVDVNEEGTEAAAASAVAMMFAGGIGNRPPEPIVFKADHPFLFFIWERKTNTVFFSGRLIDPK